MKTLHFQLENDLSLLHDELLAAVPSLRPVQCGFVDPVTRGPTLEPVMRMEGLAGEVWLVVPDDAEEAAIELVVRAHNPALSQPDPSRQRLDRIAEIQQIPRSSWTSAQMRELIDLMAAELIS